MFNIKKKLNALMPGQGTRGALQNVLTVEWSGHKTVLVEVPNAGPSRSNEMEMAGMGDGRDYGGYGKLDDVDEDERMYLTKPSGAYFDQPRSSNNSSPYELDDVPPPLPPKKHVAAKRFQSNNPFDREQDDVLDFAPRPLPSPKYTSYSQPSTKQMAPPNPYLRDEEHRESRPWSSFENGRSPASAKKQEIDIWSGSTWGNGSGVGQTSPTSSRGTRNSSSTLPDSEDPFR